eukprot:3142961-Pleurochrysis_carterae.AAC.5
MGSRRADREEKTISYSRLAQQKAVKQSFYLEGRKRQVGSDLPFRSQVSRIGKIARDQRHREHSSHLPRSDLCLRLEDAWVKASIESRVQRKASLIGRLKKLWHDCRIAAKWLLSKDMLASR